jgi:hypothetical protein
MEKFLSVKKLGAEQVFREFDTPAWRRTNFLRL